MPSIHFRMYHHTMTCLPVHPKELDIDSEGESDPLWLQHKTMQMIDEFTDVNEGEKELMKMWNLHVMKYGYVGDCQIPVALDMFIDCRGRDLLRKNLYRNFILHVCSMFDFGLVSPEVMQNAIRKLQVKIILWYCFTGRFELTKIKVNTIIIIYIHSYLSFAILTLWLHYQFMLRVCISRYLKFVRINLVGSMIKFKY